MARATFRLCGDILSAFCFRAELAGMSRLGQVENCLKSSLLVEDLPDRRMIDDVHFFHDLFKSLHVGNLQRSYLGMVIQYILPKQGKPNGNVPQYAFYCKDFAI